MNKIRVLSAAALISMGALAVPSVADARPSNCNRVFFGTTAARPLGTAASGVCYAGTGQHRTKIWCVSPVTGLEAIRYSDWKPVGSAGYVACQAPYTWVASGTTELRN